MVNLLQMAAGDRVANRQREKPKTKRKQDEIKHWVFLKEWAEPGRLSAAKRDGAPTKS
jgi:hypothetical protein